MSSKQLQDYLWQIAQESLIPKLNASSDQINSLLSPDQKDKLRKYLDWSEYYDWKSNEKWSAIGERVGNNSDFYDTLQDFLAASYSISCCKIKPVPYKDLLESATKIKASDKLDIEKLIVNAISSEIFEEENIKNFIRFGELIDSIKDPENLSTIKTNLYIQTSDLVMDEPDNALELAQVLYSLSSLAEKADYEIVSDLVEKYIKVLNYNENILKGEEPAYEFYERTNKSEFCKSLALLRKFPFDKENKEKFQQIFDKFKPNILDEVDEEEKIPVNENEEEIMIMARKLYNLNPNLESDMNDLPIKSWNQIEKIESIITKPDLEVIKAIIKDTQGNPFLLNEEGKQKLVAVKINNYFTNKEERKLGMQGMFMSTMDDNSGNFLKLYGSFFDTIGSQKRYILVMELAKETLKDKIISLKGCDKPEREEQALKALGCLVRSMKILNEKGISHRDIKPDNIFISEDGRYLIADFDVSEEIKRDDYGRTIKTEVRVVGTKYYMAPEIRALMKADALSSEEISSTPSVVDINSSKHIDFNVSDVYSLAITVLLMVTNESYTKWNQNQNLQEFIHEIVDRTIKNEILKKTLKRMFTVDPQKRPKFRELDKDLTIELSTKKDEFE